MATRIILDNGNLDIEQTNSGIELRTTYSDSQGSQQGFERHTVQLTHDQAIYLKEAIHDMYNGVDQSPAPTQDENAKQKRATDRLARLQELTAEREAFFVDKTQEVVWDVAKQEELDHLKLLAANNEI